MRVFSVAVLIGLTASPLSAQQATSVGRASGRRGSHDHAAAFGESGRGG